MLWSEAVSFPALAPGSIAVTAGRTIELQYVWPIHAENTGS
jgi:hypothetical protein